MGVQLHHNSALLWEPWRVQKQDGTPFKVFTPRKGCLSLSPRQPTRSVLQYASVDCGGSSLGIIIYKPAPIGEGCDHIGLLVSKQRMRV